ncbi:MAG: phosphoserine phosphatase SerB [Rhodothalassiaceae bacterium]
MPDASLHNVATLVVKPQAGDAEAAAEALAEAMAAAGARIIARTCLGPGAHDLAFSGLPLPVARAIARAHPLTQAADIAVQPVAGRRKRLLVADMDSTMITVECIDELADLVGCKAEVAAVTAAAMRGEIDFAAALRERVALLAGLPLAAIERCLAERVRPAPGAATLVRTMAASGARTMLVSGGFTLFAEPVARQLGFDAARANRLETLGDRLSGRVLSPVLDAAGKRAALIDARAETGLARSETLAVGDGANDIAMVEAAGFGVASYGKPALAAVADAAIRHGDLTALLYFQGYRREEFVASGQ